MIPAATRIEFEYDPESGWSVYDGDGLTFWTPNDPMDINADLQGATATLEDENESGYRGLNWETTVATNGSTNIADLGDFNWMDETLNGIPKVAIKELEIGKLVTSLPDYFMRYSNNKSNLISVYLSNATSLSSIGEEFLSWCFKLQTVNVGNLAATIAATSTHSFSVGNSPTAPAYANGITIIGSTAADWLTRFPNSTSNPYRKLLLGS